MSAYEITAIAVLIAALVGGSSGFLTWKLSRNRATSIAVGATAAFVAVAAAAWIYYTRVLCPPGAGCV